MAYHILFLTLLALTSSLATASDPSQLQDFCVADNMSHVFVNGLVCKDPKLALADDFFFSGLNMPGNTSNRLGSKVTLGSEAVIFSCSEVRSVHGIRNSLAKKGLVKELLKR
ncbi:uncharacterized protein A4U43_C06F680 [Asparagus officinalis]|uniref:Cupin type-1 domain-containing protein n=1 Tax=Asparagus officinalis TaxID=4686 RepID=A0A5P1EIL2_ASPOF|nr:uncharacterized protein A4U43_C06F680 [Asparagus officinalis]